MKAKCCFALSLRITMTLEYRFWPDWKCCVLRSVSISHYRLMQLCVALRNFRELHLPYICFTFTLHCAIHTFPFMSSFNKDFCFVTFAVKPEEKLVVIEEQPLPEHPEVMIFVAFHGLPKQPTKVTMLSEMVSALSRKLLITSLMTTPWICLEQLVKGWTRCVCAVIFNCVQQAFWNCRKCTYLLRSDR